MSDNTPKDSLKDGAELEAVIMFLLGEQPLDGYWFGDYRKEGNQWWRKPLREAYSNAQARTRSAVIAEVRAGASLKMKHMDNFIDNVEAIEKGDLAALLNKLDLKDGGKV